MTLFNYNTLNWKKYASVFTTTVQEYFAYRLNMVMWRIRQIFVFLIPFFIWSSVFRQEDTIYGYSFAGLITYLFGTTILRSLVMGSRTVDLGWMINSGYLTIALLKPISNFKFMFTRDLADKLFNLSFIILEIPLLFIIFRPPVFIQTAIIPILASLVSIVFAVLIYFFINIMFGSIGFWSRDVWAPRFLLMVVMEFATGAMFPLDMLPEIGQKILYLTPFPYLLFSPLKIYLGQEVNVPLRLLISSLWVIILYLAAKYIWNRGLRVYEAEGR